MSKVGVEAMKNNTKLTLSITAISLLLAASVPSAYAQQRSARFNFAPNIYPLENTRVPDSYYLPSASHAVKSGHVPSSKDILGIDPASLPAAPAPAAVVSQPQAQLTQATPIHYQESFGAPNNTPALAALPKTLVPLSLPKAGEKPYSANKAVSGKLLNAKHNRYIGTKVAGKLLKKNHLAGASGQALALKPAASYGKNFGYEPGAFVPTASGDGTTVKTDVSGKLLHRNSYKNGR